MNLQITEYILSDVLSHSAVKLDDAPLRDVLAILNNLNYWAIEICNKQIFLNALARTCEPWSLVKELSAQLPHARKQMSLEGQYLFSDRQFSDDVVFKFIGCAVESGIDVFCIRDALNDPHNMRSAIQAAKAHSKMVQVQLHYTSNSIEYYLGIIQELVYLNVDSIAISDTTLLMPYRTYQLINKLKKRSQLPVHFYSDYNNSFALANALKAAEANVDGVAGCLPWRTPIPYCSTQMLSLMLQGTNREPDIDKQQLFAVCELLQARAQTTALPKITRRYATDFEYSAQMDKLPLAVLEMIARDIQEKNIAADFKSIVAMVKQIQSDLGSIPLQAPILDTVIEQAFINVANDLPYAILSDNFKRLCCGYYGALPKAANDFIAKHLHEARIVHRPADILQAEYGRLFAELHAYADEQGFHLSDDKQTITREILNYAMFPEQSLRYFKQRNSTAVGDDVAMPNKDIAAMITQAAAHSNAQTTASFASAMQHTVDASADPAYRQLADESTGRYRNDVTPVSASSASSRDASLALNSANIKKVFAPIEGRIVKFMVQAGENVKQGDLLLIFEVMHINTHIFADCTGRVAALNVKEGAVVAAKQVLLHLLRLG